MKQACESKDEDWKGTVGVTKTWTVDKEIYTAPCDGYVRLYAHMLTGQSAGTISLELKIYDKNDSEITKIYASATFSQPFGQAIPVFVKKGMKIEGRCYNGGNAFGNTTFTGINT